MENLSTGRGISRIDTDITHTDEITREFSLPDYIPEIRKLLGCKVGVLPENRYSSKDNLEINGAITYLVIYSDDEGKLCAVPLSSDFEIQIPLSEAEGTLFSDLALDSVTPKVIAPRKISIKTRLKARLLRSFTSALPESIVGNSSAEEMYIQRKLVKIPTYSLYPGKCEGLKISDKFDTGSLSSYKPLWCDAYICIKECKGEKGSISVLADAHIECVLEVENEIQRVKKIVPITEEIDVDFDDTVDMARASAKCQSLSVSGEGSDLYFDLAFEIEGCGVKRQEYQATSDCYSTHLESDCLYKDVNAYEAVRIGTYTFTMQEDTKKKAGDSGEIIEKIAYPVCEKVDFKDSKLFILGKLVTTLISKINEQEYSTEGYELPFKYELDVKAPLQNPVASVSLSLGKINARYNEDRVQISADIYPSISLFDKREVSVLDKATLLGDRVVKRDNGQVKVYFPKDSDTLWEVAKMYRITEADLKKNNQIENDTLKDAIII